jgi:hypothetical protein
MFLFVTDLLLEDNNTSYWFTALCSLFTQGKKLLHTFAHVGRGGHGERLTINSDNIHGSRSHEKKEIIGER